MTTTTLTAAKRTTADFYLWMSLVCAAIAFGGFAPTYWFQLARGTFVGPVLLHLHGALFFAWIALLISQTRLVASRRVSDHRAWGLVGISLATAMVIVGLVAANNTLTLGLAAGYGDASRAFLMLPVSAIALFAGFFIAAILNIRRPDAHKRYMLLATISLLQAAMGRIFFVLVTGGGPGLRPGLGEPPPMIVGLVPSLLLDLLIIAGMAHDWRTRGRPHRAWVIGAAVSTAVIVLRRPVEQHFGMARVR